MSLYRKYRPQNFGNLVGQDHIKETLLNELRHGHLTHAYLFAGPRGTGKTSTARLIAKALNCQKLNNEDGHVKKGIEKRAKPTEKEIKRIEEIREKELDFEPCDACEFCETIAEGSLIDVMEIDAASNRGIDEIRDLREKIKFAPTRAKTKIYIIDEVHMLTKEAFNALLKTLEEPPPHVYFILCTTEIHKIPETIISRCQRFDFKRIDIKTIMTRLNYIAQKEGIEAEDAAIELIARNVQGGLRDALTLFEQMLVDGRLEASHIKEHLGITGHETVESFVRHLAEKDAEKCLHIIGSVHQEGYDMGSFLREILESLREKLVNAAGADTSAKSAELLRMIEIFLEAREKLRFSPIPQLPLEIAVLKTCEQEAAGSTPLKPTVFKEEPPILQKMVDKKMEKAATAEEEKTVEEIKSSLSEREMAIDLPNIEKHWPQVLSHVNPPSLRRSFQEGTIANFEGGKLTIEFSTKFHVEKVKTLENMAKIEQALEKVFGRKIAVASMLAQMTPREETQTKTKKPLVEPVSEGETSPKESLAEKALEIFGGEMF